MIWEKSVSEPWFSLISDGKKTSEGRLNKGDFSKMKSGDTVIWTNDDLGVRTRIIDIVRYDTIYEMIKGERLKNVLPDPSIRTIEQGVREVYRTPPVNYTEEKEKNFGVIAIRIERV